MILPADNSRGFSLIEVLVALVIFATAVMALSGSISSTFGSQIRHKEKTFAHYVAMRRLADVRLEKKWPNIGTTQGTMKMLNHDWQWQQ